MTAFLLRRLLGAIPTALAAALVLFFVVSVLPGDPVAVMMREKANPETIDRVRKTMRLDDPAPLRFLHWIGRAVQGDFGESYKLNRPVSGIVAQAIPNTALLAVAAALVAWTLGLPLGIAAGLAHRSLLDKGISLFAALAVGSPVFVVALLLQWLFALKLDLLPAAGFQSPEHLILPAITLGLCSMGGLARLVRTNVAETMRSEHIRFARAKGLPEHQVVWSHCLKNALAPVIAYMALQIASLLSGAVLTETVFGVPGLGRTVVEAFKTRDIPLFQAAALPAVLFVVFGNLAADALHALLDRRVRLEPSTNHKP